MRQFNNITLNNVMSALREKKLAELDTTTIKKLPKIVGETRHYPPANKE
jgi:hypothetical protein